MLFGARRRASANAFAEISTASAKSPAISELRRSHFLIGSGPVSRSQPPAVGPHLTRLITSWIENPPEVPRPAEIRRGFLTLPEARAELKKKPEFGSTVKGDLQMHTQWSDGSGTIEDMARAAAERHYQYIAITDHSKGLKIAGGIDEEQLKRQAQEIESVNSSLQAEGVRLQVLRSIELNLTPSGQGDMDPRSLRDLDVVLGCFPSSLRKGGPDRALSRRPEQPRYSDPRPPPRTDLQLPARSHCRLGASFRACRRAGQSRRD